MNNILTYLLLFYALGLSILFFNHKVSLRKLLKQLDNPQKRSLLRLVSPPKEVRELAIRINRMNTECQRLILEQKRFDKIRKEFLSGVSHDIRTPLTSIIGYIDAVQDDLRERSPVNEEYIKIIADKSRQLNRRVDQFFEYTKIQSVDWKIRPEVFDLAELIREVLIGFLPRIEKLSLHLDLCLECEHSMVRFDRLSLIRILENLVQNVLIHAAGGEYLGIELLRREDLLDLKISDKGVGIKFDHPSDVFSRHLKSSPSRYSSGLGLSIVHELVVKNKAAIHVDSQPNTGTVFTLSMKIVR